MRTSQSSQQSACSLDVVSFIRDNFRTAAICKQVASEDASYKLAFRVLDFRAADFSSLEGIRPDIVVWAATSMSNPDQIDSMAAKAFFKTAAGLESVQKGSVDLSIFGTSESSTLVV